MTLPAVPSRAPCLRPRAVLALVGLGTLWGCLSADEQRTYADDEVYGLLAERRAAFVANPGDFTIDPDTASLSALYQRGEADASEPLGPFSLTEALSLAAAQDTTVMSRKESLYRTALDLTFQRFLFGTNRRRAGGDATLNGQGEEATSAGFGLDAGFTRILGTGGQVLGNIGLSVFRGLLTSEDWDPISNVGLSITQPLMRGYGRRIAFEPLTQSERTLLYEVRSYERFRRTFAFGVATDFVRILQSYDQLRNAEANFEGLRRLRVRNEALAAAGRQSDIEVDQARQTELAAQSNVINTEQALQNRLDAYKDILGLPIPLQLELDESILEQLREEGVPDLEFDEERAIELALTYRNDYLNAVDRIVDTERRVVIARDALRSRLDLTIDVNAQSEAGVPLDFGPEGFDWAIGLDLDLPIDNIAERNAYRNALIDRQQATRFADDLKQIITIDIRDALRELTARRQDYEIQRNSVLVGERRVESAFLNLEAGRAQTRDLLESQRDLLASQNSLTRSLIDYRLALYAFYRDLELLIVDENGLGTDFSVFLDPDIQ